MREEQVTEGKKEIFFIFISDAVILFAYQEISAADWRLLMMVRVKCFASLHAFFFLTLCARESYIRKLIYVGVFACVCVCERQQLSSRALTTCSKMSGHRSAICCRT